MFEDRDNPVRRTLSQLRALGRTKRAEFLAAIADASPEQWFRALVEESATMPPLRIVEDGDEMELKTDEAVADLCTLVRDKIIEAHDVINRFNRFKFNIDMIKKAIRELYDVAIKGATLK